MWLILAAVVVTVGGIEMSDEEYYKMPHLFHLDDWEECVATHGTFCMGTFDLQHYKNDQLLDLIKGFSANMYHFNHTLIHRGLCLPASCSHIQDSAPAVRFSRCVSNLTRAQHGLEANLMHLQYCKTWETEKRPVDVWDLTFAYIVLAVLVMNLIGTMYDVLRNKKGKLIKPLLAWSFVANWKRLTADHMGGDQRLAALKPIQGMKAITLLLVLFAHSVMIYHMTYLHNPQFLEKSSHHFLAAYLQNGTVIVHTCMMISSFLMTYNLLIYVADNPKKQMSLKMLPKCLVHRLIRIYPLYLFVLGLATTWWEHAGDGPLWGPLMGGETGLCRDKWWQHVLFVNNAMQPDEKCLIHTWFLAVDMQMYFLTAVLTLAIGRWPRTAVKVLVGLILGAMLLNFTISYTWGLKPMVLLMVPDIMRVLFKGQRSFTWLYTSPWDSLPSALLGVLAAFVYHAHQVAGYQPDKSKLIQILYRLNLLCMFTWVVCGYFVKGITEPLWLSIYATIDRPIFISLTTFAMYGFFNKIDSLWWRFLSWRGWEILGRMSLSIYLIHWQLSVMILALRTNANAASVLDIGGHWLTTIFLTYCAALPLHLFVELPGSKFLQSLFS